MSLFHEHGCTKKFFLIFFLFFCVFHVVPGIVSAQTEGASDLVAELRGDIQQLNKLGTTDPAVLIGRIIKTMMGIMGSIALAMFVYSGFILMTGSTAVGGGATKKDIVKAKGMLVWSTLGIFVIFASYALVDFVFEIFR